MIERQWDSFYFVPNKRNAIMFHQAGSNKLLYTTLPDAASAPSPVLLFGSHTGQAHPIAHDTATHQNQGVPQTVPSASSLLFVGTYPAVLPPCSKSQPNTPDCNASDL